MKATIRKLRAESAHCDGNMPVEVVYVDEGAKRARLGVVEFYADRERSVFQIWVEPQAARKYPQCKTCGWWTSTSQWGQPHPRCSRPIETPDGDRETGAYVASCGPDFGCVHHKELEPKAPTESPPAALDPVVEALVRFALDLEVDSDSVCEARAELQAAVKAARDKLGTVTLKGWVDERDFDRHG